MVKRPVNTICDPSNFKYINLMRKASLVLKFISLTLPSLLLCSKLASAKEQLIPTEILKASTVPTFSIKIEMSEAASKILKTSGEKVVLIAKFEGLRKNGQFAGPEPPKVMSKVLNTSGGLVKIDTFELLDFDQSPLHFGGIMISAINTQQNSPRKLINCTTISQYPKVASKLQSTLSSEQLIKCSDFNGL